ncbi:Pro-Pol polyprotein [Dictyocoela roeselum]|nr:Pro-Pol polyprotein [Dictyocoela roeselum]
MRKMIYQISRSCLKCNLEKTTKTNYGETKANKSNKNVNDTLNIDIKGPIIKMHFNTNCKLEYFHIVVMTDYCSRYTKISIQEKVTSKTVISSIINKWTNKYVRPKEIISDNGRQFISSEFKYFISENNINHVLTSNYNPTGNSRVEKNINKQSLKIVMRINAKKTRKKISGED